MIDVNINIIIFIVTFSLISLTILFEIILFKFYELLLNMNYILIIIFFSFYITNSIFRYKLEIKIINNINSEKKDNDKISKIKIFVSLRNLSFFSS